MTFQYNGRKCRFYMLQIFENTPIFNYTNHQNKRMEYIILLDFIET